MKQCTHKSTRIEYQDNARLVVCNHCKQVIKRTYTRRAMELIQKVQ